PPQRIGRTPFGLGAVLVYTFMFASLGLLAGPVLVRSGIAPFAVAQAVLTYVWYELHARRLRDAGRATGSALAMALLYALGAVLFMLLVQFVSGVGTDGSTNETDGLGGLVILLFLVALLTGDASTIGLFFYAALMLLIVIFLPVLVAIG